MCNGQTMGEYEMYSLAMIPINCNFFLILVEEHIIAIYLYMCVVSR